MHTSQLLERLDGVKEGASGKWRAKCPAHDSSGLSLAIGEGDNGGILLHCFAGCDAVDVVSAIGLSLSDLFPDSDPARKPIKDYRGVVFGLYPSLCTILAASDHLANGQPLREEDRVLLDNAISTLTRVVGDKYCRDIRRMV